METLLEKFLKINSFYISTTFLPDKSNILDYLETFKINNITNIELGSNHIFDEKIFEYDFSEFDILVHNHFPPSVDGLLVNIASNDEQIRTKSIRHIYNSILFSKKNNSKLYTFHPGFNEDPISVNKNLKNYDFIWKSKKIENNNEYIFFKSLEKIISFAKKNNQKIALETEGSINHSDKLLMQNLVDINNFKKNFSSEDIKINLNIGHLNLAQKKFKFSYDDFFNELRDYIVAFEISHNYGLNDDHLPVIEHEWYWELINNSNNFLKILEYRNLTFDQILSSIKLVKNNYEKKI